MVVSRSDLFHARSLPLASRSERRRRNRSINTISPHGENVNHPSKCADLSFSSRSIKEISWLTRASNLSVIHPRNNCINSFYWVRNGCPKALERHCKTTAFRAGWLSATPDANTCSSLMTCQCHFAPRCQMRQSNIGSVKRNFRWQAGASVNCRAYTR
jgi:hypothetical protein